MRRHGRHPKKHSPENRKIGRTKLSWLYRTAALVAAIALLAAAITGALLFRNSRMSEDSRPKSAAIVDQLSLTAPNEHFVASTTGMLQQAGYLVDYYQSEDVTVDFYRYLPTFDYDLIILRVHVGLTRRVDSKTGEVTWPDYVSIFTGEPFTSRTEYPRQGVGEGVTREGGPTLYAITTGFVELTMKGRFDNTVIVMMGCDGLRTPRTAQAFLDKGAKAFIGWSAAVSASHTDISTQRMLENLVMHGLSAEESVAQAASEVGPDPWFGAELQVLLSQG